jgi:hypothetical protein
MTENLKKELDEYLKIKAEHTAFADDMSNQYNNWRRGVGESIVAALKADGLALDNMEIDMRYYSDDVPVVIDVTVKAGRNDFSFGFTNGKVNKFNIAGISISGIDAQKDLVDIQEYYNAVNLTAAVLRGGLENTFAAISAIKRPELPEWTGMNVYLLNKKINELENKINLTNFHLDDNVEVWFEVKTKRGRGHWGAGKVTGITENNLMVLAEGWNFRIKKSEIGWRIRLPK